MSGSYAVSIAKGHCMCFVMYNESVFVLSHIVSFFYSIQCFHCGKLLTVLHYCTMHCVLIYYLNKE